MKVEPLSVPTQDPFVISSGQVHATRSVLVTLEENGLTGLGEGSCLPPVTKEDQPDALASLRAGTGLGPVARAALEMAQLDLEAKKAGVPL